MNGEHVHEWVYRDGAVIGVEWVPTYQCSCGAEAVDAYPESDYGQLVEVER